MEGEGDGLLCKVQLLSIDYDAVEDDENDTADIEARNRKDVYQVCHPVNSDGLISLSMYALELPPHIVVESRTQLRRGESVYVWIPGGQLSHDSVVIPPGVQPNVLARPPQHVRRLAAPPTVGTLKMLALRVTALDSEPEASSSEIYDYLFESEVSLKSQLQWCSSGQLHVEPTDAYGVMNVNVPMNANGGSYKALVNTAYASALDILRSRGNSNIADIRDLADLILVVLPPGTGNWKGFATVGGQQSVFNNLWGTYVGATAHEVGHNLGLHHAFQSGLEYGDVTGYMGGAVRATNYPRRCYNAQNHWHVGWYSSRSIEIDPYSTSSAVYRVIPFVDFNKANTGEYAIVKLTGLDLYMQYNRQKSFNVETGELQDRLTIVRDTGEGTDLLAGLSDDSPWWQRMYDSRLLTIEVCSVQMARSSQEPDVMFVSIGFGASRCPQSNAPSSGSTSTQSSPTNRMVDSMIFPVAMVSVLVVVLVSLTAVFIRASRGKASAVASDDGDKMVESDRVTDIDNTSHSMADDSADLEQSRSPLDPYGDLASPCLWNWANWKGNCGDFGR